PMLPHAGQGAAQAIEDAVVLGRAFRGADTVERALRTYERLRIPRTRAITRLSARNARLGSIRHPLVCWLRDEVIRAAPPAAILRAQVAIGRPPKHLWGDDERNAPTRSKRSALSETQDG
ncbi:MAG TPA: hypothetical protein VKY73_07445, partial [Polyangiaceae bacterium]|nr:hypothetical protein [Polyangiaceae bacterium]